MISIDIVNLVLSNKEIIIIFLGYVILLSTSGKLLVFILSRVDNEKSGKQTKLDSFKNIKNKKTVFANKREMDTGFIIGKCENVLIMSLVLANAYTALALIFAAKTIIREDDIKNNSLYFLAGTLINVTYSIIVGLIIKSLVHIN